MILYFIEIEQQTFVIYINKDASYTYLSKNNFNPQTKQKQNQIH